MNERLQGDEAVFFRVLQHGEVAQTALVLLNKGDSAKTFTVARYVQAGRWRDALDGGSLQVDASLKAEAPAHGVKVYVLDAAVQQPALQAELDKAMADQRARDVRLGR